MHSHHSHSGSFCQHAVGTLEAVVLETISTGFKVYGLSEHVPRYRERDLYPEEESKGLAHLSSAFEAYLEEAHRLKSRYADQITLLVGLETDFITELDLDGLDELLKKHGDKVEYLVGSIHHVNEIPIDFDEETWRKAVGSFDKDDEGDDDIAPSTMVVYLSAYFDAQLKLMERFHPEIIGHFDLCRLYMPSLHLSLPAYSDVWHMVERNVDYAIGYGACFEVNAAAFRKKWATAYPGEEVLQLIISKGGRLALSDDSHGPAAVALNYRPLFDYLVRMEVKDIWYLGVSDEPNAGGRKVKAIKYEGDWTKDPFWTQLP